MAQSGFFKLSMGRWLMMLLLMMLTSVAARAVEAYACYTPSNTTLTFYYDNSRSNRTGTTYDLNTGYNNPGWYTDGTYSSVTKVVFNSNFINVYPTSTYRWFYNMTNLMSITSLQYLMTSHVILMNYMFYNCSNLTSLYVSNFNTANVVDMCGMFYNCSKLTSLNVSYFNTSKVTDMGGMFANCSGLSSLNVTNFDTSSATNLGAMFQGCRGLTSLDLSNFNTANVSRMSQMFEGCSGLTSLDLRSFNTANVEYMDDMFRACSNLVTIFADSNWKTTAVTSSGNMFLGCSKIKGGKGTAYDANHTNKEYAHIDGGTYNPGYFTDYTPQAYACYTPSNTTLTFYYDNVRGTREGTTYDLNTSVDGYSRWNSISQSVTRVVFDPSFATARPEGTNFWFKGMSQLTSIIGIEYLNTSEAISMWGTFEDCSGLTSIDLSHFDTRNVTKMARMFYGCSGLASLDVSGFNTANVTDMNSMFSKCSGLTSLDVSSFNTAQVTDMAWMFNRCSGLTSLDLSSFNTANVTSTYGMFYGCSNLTTIYVGDGWNTDRVTSYGQMFYLCNELVGGAGTTYDDRHTGIEYAHIDGGPSNPGYLTDINAPTGPEAYAVYTADNTTLTFYYDTERRTREGTTYDLNASNDGIAYWNSISQSVTRVVFDPSFATARPEGTNFWFKGMSQLTSIIGIEYLNTSEAISMWGTFEDCSGLTSIDLSHFDTRNVTKMARMFYGCSGLASLDVSGFNTANVTDMNSMFSKCSGLTSLDVSSFNTAQVTDMAWMFNRCSGLTSLDLSSFNTANVTSTYGMFYGCSNLTTIYVGDGWNTDRVTSYGQMFYLCNELVGGAGTTYDDRHTGIEYAHIDGGPSNPGYLTDINAPTGPEAYAVYTADNTTLTFYYDTERSTREGTTFDMPAENSQPGWYDDVINAAVTQAVFDDSFADARLTTTNYMFFYMTELTTITGIENLNTSSVTSMLSMFEGCGDLRNIDLSGFDTENVTNMGAMFYLCNRLTSIDVSHFNTDNVTSMYAMFTGCKGLTSLELSNFNTANVVDMSFMFAGCNKLISLDLSNFNTGKVRGMQFMFQNCSALSTIYVGDEWSTTTVNSSDNMFQNCTSLVGGQGTTYDANHTNKEYAHIDGGSSNPGYFTEKQDFLLGDVNSDHNVSIGDVTALIDYLLSGDETGINLSAADCTHDNNVSIGDVTALIDYLLSGSW